MKKDFQHEEVLKILASHNLTLDDLIKWRVQLINKGKKIDTTKYYRHILPYMDHRFLFKEHPLFRLTLDFYEVAETIGFFVVMGGGKVDPFEKVLGVWGDKYLCPFCGTLFKIAKSKKYTCGKKRCGEDHRNLVKKRKREIPYLMQLI